MILQKKQILENFDFEKNGFCKKKLVLKKQREGGLNLVLKKMHYNLF